MDREQNDAEHAISTPKIVASEMISENMKWKEATEYLTVDNNNKNLIPLDETD